MDIIVNNASFNWTGSILNMDPDIWDTQIASKLSGSFYLMYYAPPYTKEQRYGRVINTASDAILGVFRSVQFGMLVNILLHKIKDEVFIDLIWKLLRAGYLLAGDQYHCRRVESLPLDGEADAGRFGESWAGGKVQLLAGERKFDFQSLSYQIAAVRNPRAAAVVHEYITIISVWPRPRTTAQQGIYPPVCFAINQK